MKLSQLLAELVKLELDPEMEVGFQNEEGVFIEFEVLIGTHEHEDGGIIDGPDPNGWGDKAPRELPQSILLLCALRFDKRKPQMF